MKKLFLILAFLGASLAASAQNYNFNIGGLQYGSGASVPGACSRPGSYFYKNTSTKGWYICNGSTYDAISVGSSGGAVSSVFTRTGAVVAAANDYTLDLIGSPAANVTFTAPATNTYSFLGTAPGSGVGAGTAAGTTFTLTSPAGGATTGSATTGGTGGDFAFTSGAGGSGAGGTNASGGRGGNFAISLGAGGAKQGSGTVGVQGLFTVSSGNFNISTNSLSLNGTFNGNCGSGPAYTFINHTTYGLDYDTNNNFMILCGGGNAETSFTSTGFEMSSTGVYGFGSSASATRDAAISRGAPGLIDFGTGAAQSVAGFIKSAHTVTLSADWTCGTGGTVASCVAATIVGSTATPLTFTLPLVATNWHFACDLVVGQATGATANQWNILTATNGVTSTTASYQMATAATAFAVGAVTDQASTTTTFQITPSWTLGGTATKMPAHIAGTLTGASASGTVFSLQLVAPTVGDLVTIYEGSGCSIYP